MNIVKTIRRRMRHWLQNRTLPKTHGQFLLAFDSDDWGSTRIPNESVLRSLEERGISMKNDPFTSLDGLETNDDVTSLLSLLLSVRDIEGRPANFTLNICMNSPDFSAISKSGFSDYEAIPIEKVYASDAHSSECISLIRRGFSEGAFDIQLHGSQHLNVSAWMKAGKAGDHDVMRSCSYGLVSTGSMYSPENPFAFLDELGASNEQDALQIADSLRESLVRMNDLFGSRGTALTPSCGVRSPFYKTIEERFNYTKGAFIEFKRDANGVYRKMIMTKSRAARYKCLVRNCTFEPSWNEAAANDCLADIEFAFAHSRPAIVSTHRINYSSRLSEKNRERSLKQLRSLLESVLKRYPNVRFVTTEEIAKDWLKGS